MAKKQDSVSPREALVSSRKITKVAVEGYPDCYVRKLSLKQSMDLQGLDLDNEQNRFEVIAKCLCDKDGINLGLTGEEVSGFDLELAVPLIAAVNGVSPKVADLPVEVKNS